MARIDQNTHLLSPHLTPYPPPLPPPPSLPPLTFYCRYLAVDGGVTLPPCQHIIYLLPNLSPPYLPPSPPSFPLSSYCRYLAVDGGVTLETAALAAAAGANVLIAGTTIFGKNRQENSHDNSSGNSGSKCKSIQQQQQHENSNDSNNSNSNDLDSDSDTLFIANNIRALEQALMTNGL